MTNLSIIEGGIIITTKLEGTIGGCVKHVSKQSYTVQLSNNLTLTRVIKHTDREIKPCYRRTSISGNIVHEWINSSCPDWESPKKWRVMNWKQKLVSFANSFDEGFGIEIDFVNK